MKCLLLLLSFGLATADKLDRTYLPPSGAKFAGGSPDELKTPLEYPVQTYPGIAQNNNPAPNDYQENTIPDITSNQELDHGIPTVDYSTPSYSSDFGNTNYYPTSGFPTTLRPDTNSYNSLPLKSPYLGYLPSKPSTFSSQQSFIAPTSNPLFQTTSSTIPNGYHNGNEKVPGYFYFVPTQQPYLNNNIPSQDRDNNILSSNTSNFDTVQYSNQVNDNDYLSGNEQAFTPKLATTNNIAQSYQPSAFGYYGGNPMIMTSQNYLPQEFRSTGLTTKFEDYEDNVPKMLLSQEIQKTNDEAPPQPFQTPLVRTNVQKEYKFGDSKTTYLPNYTEKPQFSNINNTPVELNQSNVLNRFQPERPLAKSDRNAIILNYENFNTPKQFSYSFDTSNGIHADESGTAIGGVKVKGSYSYTGDDGKIYSVTYTADENGFQPKGDHLPTPPPVPEAIKKVIEQAAKNRAAGIIDDGSYDEKKYGHMNYQGAMDRYRPFKNNKVNRRIGNNFSRPSSISRRPNKNIGNVPITSAVKTQSSQLINKRPQNPVHNQEDFKNGTPTQTNQNNASKISIKDQLDSNKRLANTENNLIENNAYVKNIVSSEPKPEEINQNERQGPYQYKRPITSFEGYNPIGKGESPTTEKKNLPNSLGGVTITDDGYYYVPPFIKFNPVSNEPVNKENTYITSDKPAQKNIDTTVSKRIDIDDNLNQQTNDKIIIPTQTPFNDNILSDSTRKPYVSGPKDHDMKHDYDETIPVDNDENPASVDKTDLDYSSYVSNTAPTTSQTTQYENQPANGYFYPNQYYQTTTIPGIFDQNQPTAVSNRVNIPSKTPGVSISQNFSTTTYKPGLFNDGVLEVNQNVKIYGLGRTEPNAFSDTVIYNDKFYTTAVPNHEEPRPIGTYLDIPFGRPSEDTVQENTNQGYGNEFLTTGGPVFDSAISLNELNTPVFGLYANPDFEGQFKEETDEFPKGQSSISNELTSSNEITTPTVIVRSQTPTQEVIGEDFSGPKKPQYFDPLTGYHYK